MLDPNFAMHVASVFCGEEDAEDFAMLAGVGRYNQARLLSAAIRSKMPLYVEMAALREKLGQPPADDQKPDDFVLFESEVSIESEVEA